MRIAAVQIEIDAKSRAETLQRALRGIDFAAEADPAPDLVVLPAFLDTCNDGPDSKLEYLYGAGTAACGFRARSWGVFVAMGFGERALPKPRLKSVLFDRDGDHLLVQSLSKAGGVLAGQYEHGVAELNVARVLIGRIACFVDDDIVNRESWREAVAKGAQLIVGTIGAIPVEANRFESELVKLSREFGVPCVVADITGGVGKTSPERPGVSRIVDSSGKVVAASDANKPGVITADLELPTGSAPDEPLAATGTGD